MSNNYNEEMNTRHYVETMVEKELMEELEEMADYYVEESFRLRWEEVEMFHLIGQKIYSLISRGVDVDTIYTYLRKNTKKRVQNWEFALILYRAYPDLNLLPEGKNVSVSMLKKKLLPEKVQKRVTLRKILKQHLRKFQHPKNDYEKGRKDEAESLLTSEK